MMYIYIYGFLKPDFIKWGYIPLLFETIPAILMLDSKKVTPSIWLSKTLLQDPGTFGANQCWVKGPEVNQSKSTSVCRKPVQSKSRQERPTEPPHIMPSLEKLAHVLLLLVHTHLDIHTTVKTLFSGLKLVFCCWIDYLDWPSGAF